MSSIQEMIDSAFENVVMGGFYKNNGIDVKLVEM